jgi:4-carboxymuconolactone decarboxylase
VTGRLQPVRPEQMDDSLKALYDHFTTGRRAAPGSPFTMVGADGLLTGPASIWVHNAELGHAQQKIGAQVRYGATIEARAREIAILMVGHHYRCDFELYAHERAGLAAGLTQADLSTLALGEPPSLETDEERIVFATTRAILRHGGLTDEEYAAAAGALTVPRLVELVTLVSYYTMVAIQLNVFRVAVPTDD